MVKLDEVSLKFDDKRISDLLDLPAVDYDGMSPKEKLKYLSNCHLLLGKLIDKNVWDVFSKDAAVEVKPNGEETILDGNSYLAKSLMDLLKFFDKVNDSERKSELGFIIQIMKSLPLLAESNQMSYAFAQKCLSELEESIRTTDTSKSLLEEWKNKHQPEMDKKENDLRQCEKMNVLKDIKIKKLEDEVGELTSIIQKQTQIISSPVVELALGVKKKHSKQLKEAMDRILVDDKEEILKAVKEYFSVEKEDTVDLLPIVKDENSLIKVRENLQISSSQPTYPQDISREKTVSQPLRDVLNENIPYNKRVPARFREFLMVKNGSPIPFSEIEQFLKINKTSIITYCTNLRKFYPDFPKIRIDNSTILWG